MRMLRSLFALMSCLLFACVCLANPISDSSNIHAYAGIEIGAKGVKMCVIRERITPAGQHEVVSVLERTQNTELVSLTQQSVIATAWAVRSFLDTLTWAYHIPQKLVFIVVSSGAKLALDNADKLEEVRESIRSAIDEPNREVYYVRPDQEATLMAEGMIALNERESASLCDIGGGNTKGGRFVQGKFVTFSLPYGTRTLLNLIPRTDSIPLLVKRMDSLYKAKLREEYTSAATSPGMQNSQTMYFVGGIIWIISTFTYPEKVLTPYVDLTLDDLKRFREMAGTDFHTLSHPPYDPALPNAPAIEKALNQARTTYDRKALIAGANLAYGLALASATQNPQVRFVFDRNAGLSWIRGLVRQTALTGGTPELGRL